MEAVANVETTNNPTLGNFDLHPIDLAIVKLALENNNWSIKEPLTTIPDLLGIPVKDVRDRIQFLKKEKLVTTKSRNNGTNLVQLKVGPNITKIVLENNLPELNGNGNGSKVEAKSQALEILEDPDTPIWIMVDYENIRKTEIETGIRVSYVKLREYARRHGNVFVTEVFAPHHHLNEKRKAELNHFNSYDWKFIIVGDTKKDKDQVDFRIINEVEKILFNHKYIQADVWIISCDSDFLSIVELSKDRGKNNVRLINPFQIPEILGLEGDEIKSAIPRNVQSVIESMDRLTDVVMEKETDEQKLVRYTMAWLKSQKEDYVEFGSFPIFIHELHTVLSRQVEGSKKLRAVANFPKNVIVALREKGVIHQVNNGKVTCKFVINKNHELFLTAAPPKFSDNLFF